MKPANKFLSSEALGGVLLFSAAVLALIFTNTNLHDFYVSFLDTKFSVNFADFKLEKPVMLWVNDGLMAVYFLLVGLEIKREMCHGVLKSKDQITLPAIGALGGLIFPALIYVFINYGDSNAMRGWAIPSATDIAFSLAILGLLGKLVPTSLKMFLTALAIFDDIAAIVIIAIFYSGNLSYISLIFAGIFILILFLMNRLGVKAVSLYIFVGIFLWLSVLKSGVHATLAGIVIAMAIPIEGKTPRDHSPLERLEDALLPWVTFIVLPLFAFCNAGLKLEDLQWSELVSGIPLGIILGLVVGKQLGIFTACWLMIKCKLAKLPENVGWSSLYGVSIICGVGFTMSLFIGSLAFKDSFHNLVLVRLGVLVGSTVSGILGYSVLRYCLNKKTKQLAAK